jgi:hypothetical protein
MSEVISAARPSGDFSRKEIGLAILFALLVQGGAVLSLRVAGGHGRPAIAPEVEPNAPIPVRILPVIEPDAPLLKLGGEPDPTRLPDRFIPQAPTPRAEEKAFVSTKAGKTEDDIPPKDVKLAEPNEPPPPPEAELTKQVDTPVTAETPSKPPANVAEEGHQDGVQGGTETDPLKARAVDLYRARIISWFSRRFRVSGSGLSAEDLAKYKVAATVELSNDRMVVGYSIAPSGNAAFDAAARAALEGAKGAPLPPPPENYPDVVQRHISLTFVCKEDRCD